MKRKPLPAITPPDPNQIMMAGVAPVSMGERLGWLAAQPMQPRREQRPLDVGFSAHRLKVAALAARSFVKCHPPPNLS